MNAIQKISCILFSVIIILVLSSGKTKQVKVFMIGDSTMADKSPVDETPERGWGMVFPSFFSDRVLIENHARNGRSTKSFIAEGRWDFVMSRMGEGDYVFIQFGHNDEAVTKKTYTSEDEFEANFRKMVRDVRSKGANPILCTSLARRKFDSIGNLVDTHPVYPAIIRKVAAEMNVPLIDMKTKSEKLLQRYGVEESKQLFMHIPPEVWKKHPEGKTDNTHFVDAGALEMAKLAVEGIKELKIKPLEKYLLKPDRVKLKYTIPVEGLENIKPKQ
ncbi:MAG: rhamnogalacturonan acetylesterase [Bacteroidales bacterium]|nr:rhamnogalacturonan acetylesterase [Bacteroidales bacterium]